MVDIPFPQSSQGGFQPGEGAGRLLNRYFESDGQIVQWKLVPGLVAYGDTGLAGPRGQIDVNQTLYLARNNTAMTMLPGGAVTVIPNALPGTDTVYWARNNRIGDTSTPPQAIPAPTSSPVAAPALSSSSPRASSLTPTPRCRPRTRRPCSTAISCSRSPTGTSMRRG